MEKHRWMNETRVVHGVVVRDGRMSMRSIAGDVCVCVYGEGEDIETNLADQFLGFCRKLCMFFILYLLFVT